MTCGEVSFQRGETKKTVQVALLDDTLDESGSLLFSWDDGPYPEPDAESFTVALSRMIRRRMSWAPAQVAVRIVDDESASSNGSWGALLPSGIVAVHAALLPTGKVCIWIAWATLRCGRQMPRLAQSWGPATTPFATALPFLADGRLLVCGGHGSMHGAAMQDGIGVPQTSAFNPVEETWQQLPLMNEGPVGTLTVVTQSDGSALAISARLTHCSSRIPWLRSISPAQYVSRSRRSRSTTREQLSTVWMLYPGCASAASRSRYVFEPG